MKHLYPDRPKRPFFGSGPCVKPLGWSSDLLKGALVGRSHRSVEGLSAIGRVLHSLRTLLCIPTDYMVVLTPGSATGSCEMAMWNLLGAQPVDVLCWDVFSRLWHKNARNQMGLAGQDIMVSAPCFDPCQLKKSLANCDPDNDFIFTWTGTTSGISMDIEYFTQHFQNRQGLVLCDATSAVMTTTLPWEHMDAISFSWQKALAGEASLGVLVLSPKSMQRLESWSPPWPIPRILRLKESGVILKGPMRGETINTPSMLLIKEMQVLLDLWHHTGGLSSALDRVSDNNAVIDQWCTNTSWVRFLHPYSPWRSCGPTLLTVDKQWFHRMDKDVQWSFYQRMSDYLRQHGAAFDILNHPKDYPGLRVWCGPSVEKEDITALCPWIDGAFSDVYKTMGLDEHDPLTLK